MIPIYHLHLVLYPDLDYSLSRLTRPVFTLSSEWVSSPPAPLIASPTLAPLAGRVLCGRGSGHEYVTLVKRKVEGIQCAQLIECAWAHPETLLNVEWAMWMRLISTLDIVSSIPEEKQITPVSRKLESTRVCLVLWTMWIDGTVMVSSGLTNFCPSFPDAIISVTKRRGFQELHTALCSWNNVLRTLSNKSDRDEFKVFMLLAHEPRNLEQRRFVCPTERHCELLSWRQPTRIFSQPLLNHQGRVFQQAIFNCQPNTQSVHFLQAMSHCILGTENITCFAVSVRWSLTQSTV